LLVPTLKPFAERAGAANSAQALIARVFGAGLQLPTATIIPFNLPPIIGLSTTGYAEVNGLPFRPLTHEALLRLTSCTWRGNVRELENTIHRAVLLADGTEIGIEAIELGPPAAGAQAPVGGGIASLVGRRMEEVERDLIVETLGHTLGNRTHAATILGISIRALRNKLRDYVAHGVMVPRPAAGVAA
jgi:two-component system, response regulator FlrC